MPVKFTKHARERMTERQISVAEVFRVLAFGHPRDDFASNTCKNDVWTIDPQRAPDPETLKVLSGIAVVCTADLQVVTVYRITSVVRRG